MREYLQSGKLRWKMGKSREYGFKRSIFSASHVSLQEDRTLAFPLIWSDVDFASKSARRKSCPGWLGVRSSFFLGGSRWDTKGLIRQWQFSHWKNAKEHKISRRRLVISVLDELPAWKLGWLDSSYILWCWWEGRLEPGLKGHQKLLSLKPAKSRETTGGWKMSLTWCECNWEPDISMRVVLTLGVHWNCVEFEKNRPGSQQKCWASSPEFSGKWIKVGHLQ